MSYITEIIITGDFWEEDQDNIKSHLKKFTKDDIEFNWIDGKSVGGNRIFTTDLLLGSFNYMDYKLFIKTINGLESILDIYDYLDMQVMIKNDGDERWYVHHASELELKHFLR